MKILQVVSFFSPTRGGGVIAVVYQLAKALRQRGHEVTIYTSNFELDREYIESLQGVKVHPFHHYLSLNGRPLLTPGVLSSARRELRNFDIIHMHESRTFANIALHHYALKYGIPYIVDAHGSARKSKSKLKWLIDVFFGRRILRDASMVIAETEVGAAEYREAGVIQDRIVTFYPPFPVEDYSSLPLLGRFRKRFNIKEKHIILFLGRINWIKGLDFLVESFYELSRQRDDVILAIVGSDDGHKSALETMIDKLNLSDKVLFAGYLDGEEKQSALVDAAVMVQPSVYEQGLPWASVEAILCDTPIIVSKGTGADEDVIRMDAGYLVEYGNTAEFGDTVQKILDNPAEAASITQKAKDYIMANLSMQKKVEEYERIYATCLKQTEQAKSNSGA